ncbi:DUF4870 family protein [Aquisalimonas asiatica]|uniref:Uncharacterized membrane protein n=1 Tax=Aquisalimonas asiatica TaxID=406100 RepID=A0A1H8TJ77_9GAMM|nr:hypothetical protein [Aquisalimonas asiatica]SEO91130.1 Uncharacterized membrane protein [Aquisalimonas asiatica]
MNDRNSVSAQAGDSASRQMPMVIYVLYLVGFLTSGITTLIGVILAYVNRRDAPAWVQTHYTFQIRTFWIALLTAFVGGVLSLVFIGVLILLALMIWTITRCAVGLSRLGDYKPIPRPESWLTGR